jgi:hypothetical protein
MLGFSALSQFTEKSKYNFWMACLQTLAFIFYFHKVYKKQAWTEKVLKFIQKIKKLFLR